MTQTINRKNFLALTITFTALGVTAACSDDDDDTIDGMAGKGGAAGNGGKSAGGANSGGTTTAGNAGTATGGKGGASTGGNAGTSSGGNAGTSNGGNAGTANGGKAGSAQAGESSSGSGGDLGAGGSQGGSDPDEVAGAGGNTAGAAGAAGGGPIAAMCQAATLAQTATTGNGHDHIPDDPATYFADFTARINGGSSTTAFMTFLDSGHQHTITLTVDEVLALREGGTVTGKTSSNVFGHTHTYTISCA